MKLYTDTHRLAVWLIVLVIAGSSVNLALETRDILQLYSTIRELDFTMSTMALQSNSTSTVILAQLRAEFQWRMAAAFKQGNLRYLPDGQRPLPQSLADGVV